MPTATLAARSHPPLRLAQGLAGAGPPETKSFIQEGQTGAAGAPSAETQAKYGDVDKVGCQLPFRVRSMCV